MSGGQSVSIVNYVFDEISMEGETSLILRLNEPLPTDLDIWDEKTIDTVKNHLLSTGGYIGDKSINGIFESVGKKNIPTFIMSGSKDNWGSAESGKEIHELIEGALFFEFENVSHWAFLEKPEVYHRKILTFLKST